MIMTLYIIKNEQNEEISAYTNLQRAKYMSEELSILSYQIYRVEELVVEGNGELGQNA